MSKTIDEKVVSMKFDNQQFESNVKTSLSTLDRLKRSLKLEDAAKGLENIDSASRKLDFNPLKSGVESISAKFSALEVMAVTALANITNSAVNAGKRLVSAFTIEPIKSGFQEYETQINAVQTILANTQSKGTTLNDVNAALDELNTYADKTIYNFTEMTRNIGTFTAAGIGLKESTAAIQGIANLAAVSGSNSQQASTAMYQLSQALSAGTVKLQDWNSVVNAGMGGQVFQDALKKTARAHGVAVDDMIKKNGSFRESLQEGWITSEILTETLSKMTKSGAAEYLSELTGVSQDQITATQEAVAANKDGSASYEELAEKMAETGKVSKEDALEILKMADTAEDAATKVKTFSQLMDTLKEAAQSGWTQTWEILIGDFEEAKELWTQASDYFGEAINKSAEARNKMLEVWAHDGGRELAIDSLKNAFEGLLSIVKPIKEAFRDIFPKMTSHDLIVFTKRLHELTEKMKLSEKQQERLKATFKGLFSIIDIGVTFVKQLIGGILKFAGSLSGAGDGLLNITGSLGDWLSKLRDSVKETDIFGKAIDGIVGFLQKGIEKIKEFYGILKEKFKAPGMESFLNIMQSVWQFIQKIGSKVGDVFSSIASGIGEAFNNGDIKKGLDVLNGGLFASLLLSLKNIISGGDISESIQNLLHPIQAIKDSLGPVTSVLDEVKRCLQAWQSDIKANTILKIASAIGILTISLVILSSIDQSKLSTSIMAITGLFADLLGAMAIFGKMDSMSKGAERAAGLMIGMSIAILILSSALKKLSDLSIEDIGKGLLGILGLTAIIVQASKSLATIDGKAMKGALNMILFAAAVKILASACKSLSTLSWEELAKGLSGSVVLMYVLAECAKKMSGGKGLISAGVGMIAFAAAIKIMATAVQGLANLSWMEIAKGLSAVVVMMYTMTGAMKTLSGTKGLVSAGIGMIAIAGAVTILASAVERMSSLSWKGIAKGMAAIAGSLAAIVIAVKLMPKNMISIGLGLLAVSGAISIMANALSAMGSMSLDSIINSLILLGSSLAILAVALNVMNGTLSGSAALLVAAAALAILAPVLSQLGSLSLSEISMALLTLAGTFAVLGVAGLLLGPVVPSILGLAGALALIGLAAVGVGAGLFLVSAGLSALAVSGAAGATALVAALTIILTGIISLIPTIITGIINGITLICQSIITMIPTITQVIIAIITAVSTAITTCAPTIVNTVLMLLDTLLQGIATYLPSIVQSGVDILMALLDGISSNIGAIASKAVEVVTNFLSTVGEEAPKLVDAGIDLMVNLINGLADGVVENAQKIHDAMVNLVESLIEAFCTLLGIHSPSTVFKEYGGNIIDGLVNGIKSLVTKPIEAIKNLATNLVSAIGGKVKDFLSKGKELMTNLGNGIKNKLSDVKSKVTSVVTNAASAIKSKASDFLSKGKDLMSKLGDGIKSKVSAIKDKAKEVANGALSSIKDKMSSFSEIGKNMMSGLGDGIKSMASSVVDKAKGVVNSALSGAKKLLGIASPSKEFKKIGVFVDEGFIIGLEKYRNKVADASAGVGQASIDGMSSAISSIADMVENNIDSQPTIRPVMDLDDIYNGIGYIDDALSEDRSLDIVSKVGAANSMMNNRQNATNSDVISAINKLNKSLGAVGNTSYTINGITYDDGTNISEAVKTLVRAARVERRM